MNYRFTDADKISHKPGYFFFGADPDTGQETGIDLERHTLTVAGSGCGKGVSLIIPNLKKWTKNVLIIDPGGGNARATWEAREALGQTVHVLDPAGVSLVKDEFHAGVPARLRKSFNPLARLDPAKNTYVEDLGIVLECITTIYDEKHGHWDNAGKAILAGIIDYLMQLYPRAERTLPKMRELLLQPPAKMKEFAQELSMGSNVQRAAGTVILTDLEKPQGYLQNAVENSAWLDSKIISETLAASTCELLDLKTKDCTVYLVLDPNYLVQHAKFFRLFVRMALAAMVDNASNEKDCLFILDEFFALGKIDYVQKAAGLMRKNGVHLWPILQNYDQLFALYGKEGGDVFISNADALTFFGLDHDIPAADYVSHRLGVLTPNEVAPDVPEMPKPASVAMLGQATAVIIDKRRRAAYDQAKNDYEHRLRLAGSPRVTATEIRAITGRPRGAKVARAMIVLAQAGDVFRLQPVPYYAPPPVVTPKLSACPPPGLLGRLWRFIRR